MENAVVTGTSSGIGLATSLHLARHGYRVFAGMRNLSKAGPLREAAAAEQLPVHLVELDVTSPASVTAAFGAVVADDGRECGCYRGGRCDVERDQADGQLLRRYGRLERPGLAEIPHAREHSIPVAG